MRDDDCAMAKPEPVCEIIAPGAFAGHAGKQVPLTFGGLGGPRIGTATVTGADDDGVTVTMRIDPDAPVAAPMRSPRGGKQSSKPRRRHRWPR